VRAAIDGRPAPAVRRVLARVECALDEQVEAEEAALALGALGELVDLLAGRPDDSLTRELAGSEEEQGELGMRRLVEVGRGHERSPVGWETRLLVDLDSGELLREAGVPERGGLSLGLPGRRLVVNLGARLHGSAPGRLRVYQYEYQPAAPEADLSAALGHASPLVESEWFAAPLLLVLLPRPVLIAPARLESAEGVPVIVDADDQRLSVSDETTPGACEVLLDLNEPPGSVRAVSGALIARAAGARLAPWSAIVERDGRLGVVQLAL
jgi:hypothetical protein